MMKNEDQIRDTIIETVLPDVPFDGWNWDGIKQAAEKAGYDQDMASAVFPAGLKDAVAHFADLADRRMIEKLAGVNPENMRVRDRISYCVLTRLDVLRPHKEAVRRALSYWSLPGGRSMKAGKTVWRTADRIWDWAGDTATDYNRYTKRTLLSAILSTTMLVWLDDDSENEQKTKDFLDRRIENVMQLGRILGKMKKMKPHSK